MPSSDSNWQKKLLPFMQVIIILLTAFYLVASVYQFNSLSQKIEEHSNININRFLGTYTIDSAFTKPLSKDDKAWLAQCFFESYVIETRQHNAEYLIISRTWIKYLGFITGMILCVVGAIFILGKLSDKNSTAFETGTGNSKFALNSHSPGIMIAGFGTLLILCTIFTHQYIEKTDAAVYFHTQQPFSQEAILNILKELPDSALIQIADTTVKRPGGF